jgi:hypothetical protein
MMKASYFDPFKDKAVEVQEFSADDVQGLLDTILGLRSQSGHPTLELTRPDGTSLSLSTDGELAYLVWSNSLGESFHSVGSGGCDGVPLVFDYFGSWSEAPQQYLVRLEDAVQCAKTYSKTGTANTDLAQVPVSGRFRLVYLVANTLFCLLSQERQVECFGNVARALEPGGKFVIECFVPDVARFDRDQRVQARSVTEDSAVIEVSRRDRAEQRVSTQMIMLDGQECICGRWPPATAGQPSST